MEFQKKYWIRKNKMDKMEAELDILDKRMKEEKQKIIEQKQTKTIIKIIEQHHIKLQHIQQQLNSILDVLSLS